MALDRDTVVHGDGSGDERFKVLHSLRGGIVDGIERASHRCDRLIALGLATLLLLLAIPKESCAVGTVVAWGADDSGQIDIPAGLSDAVAVAGGAAHSLALRRDGAVTGWGFNSSGQAIVPAGLTNIAAVSAGASYSLALQIGGTIRVWGAQGPPPAEASNATAIAAGWYHSLALRSDGTVVSWGSQSGVPGGLSNITAIAAGNGQSLALRADGSVVAWGDNSYGKTNVPVAASSNIVAVAAGGDHCLALQSNGRILAWGRNDAGQATVPEGLTNAAAIAAGALHSVALMADGTLAAWGDNSYGQSTVTSGDAGYVALAAGAYHNLAIKGDGKPNILIPPSSQTAVLSRSASFQVFAVGNPPLAYQWQHAGSNIAGATVSSLILSYLQFNDAGPYAVTVANNLGQTTCPPAVLLVVGAAPVVRTPPVNQTAGCGDGAVFTVLVDGSSPFRYQWQRMGTNLAGATQSILALADIGLGQAGTYTVVVTNQFGTVSTGAVLTVTVQPPQITSSLTASGKQGRPFNYQITALHSPSTYRAAFLPNGLGLNPVTGLLSGTPTDSGAFSPLISADNGCSSDTETLALTIASSIPAIPGTQTVSGIENVFLSTGVAASDAPTSFGTRDFPIALLLDPHSGSISGFPFYPGDFYSTVWASNQWGVGSGVIHFHIAAERLRGFAMENLRYSYSSPYLLDFMFMLRDSNVPGLGFGLVTDPTNLTAICLEDGTPISASETGYFLTRASTRPLRGYLVLDFSESLAASPANIASEVTGAQYFIDQQPADAQFGAYEFHREDWEPQQVLPLTSDKGLIDSAIAGIWTNYVQGYFSGSRCFDALVAAATTFVGINPNEQRCLIFVSDGIDTSSTNTLDDAMAAATNRNIQIYAVGISANADVFTLSSLSIGTGGKLFLVQPLFNSQDQFSLLSKEFQAQYILRWATLDRQAKPFTPSFSLLYQGLQADSPTNPITPAQTNIDNSTTPPTTNIVPASTNFVIGLYYPTSNGPPSGVVTGVVSLAADGEIQPASITLRAAYVPQRIQHFRVHYRPNYPCVPLLDSTNFGELLFGCVLTQTDDGAGGAYVTLTNTVPPSFSLPFPGFGPMLTFQFKDSFNVSNAFSFFSIDNSIYTNLGGQSFIIQSNSFITSYPALPFGTPVPWLVSQGYPYTGRPDYSTNELDDPDHDGMPNWKEFRANTNPRDPSSVFRLVGIDRLLDGRFHATFSTSTNRIYRLEASTDLRNWETVQDNVPGVNTNVTLTDTRFLPGVDTIFYRVAVY